ncbi:MAG TPA: Gfo/Idh/MocA family oxidoreductase [Candidatus Limnocylindrales bacterium]|jgi:predicted dehydrogenase
MNAAASRVLGVGVIGCGYWGPNLVRNFARHEQSRVVALCDAQVERAAKIASLYRVEKVTSDARELINHPDVELVVVSSPSATHYDLAKAAILAGKHVLVTKPMTTRVEHAEELVHLAERQGVILAVDHTFVYTGAVRKMRELIESGELGEIYYVDSVRINLGVFQSDVNVLWDLGPHDISIIDYVLGGTLPVEVSAVGAVHAGSRTENIAYLTMRYGPDVLAHVHVNWLAPAKIRRTIVGGSRRMIVYDDMSPSEKLLIYDKGVTIAPWNDPEQIYSQLVSYRSGDMQAPRLDDREALAVEVEDLVESITTGRQPVADGVSGVRTVRILEAAQESMRDHSRPVLVGPGVRAPVAVPIVTANRSWA